MAEVRISAQVRDPQKMSGHALRRTGQVPGVYYIRTGDNRCLQFDAKTLDNLLRKEIGVLRVEVGGEELDCIIREVQRHPVRRDIVHIDLMGIVKGEKITAHVPVHTNGLAHGVKEGGTLELILRDVFVECEPIYLPARIDLDVTKLGFHDAIRIGDLKAEGVTFIGEANTIVVHVVPPKTATETVATTATDAKEPEVIREKKVEETADKPAKK